MKKLLFYGTLFLVVSCKEKFVADVQSPQTGYLVVEGFINSGDQPTTIRLSRTVQLYDSVDVKPEHNASVTIESESNVVFPLNETGDGVYTSAALHLDPADKYHLRIMSSAGKEYVSDYSSVQQTPDIDSISWTRAGDGVTIHVNTHDDQSKSRYYKWDFTETWEFHATYYTSLIYIYNSNSQPTNVVYRRQDQLVEESLHTCWKTYPSTSIQLGSSEKLSQDKIYLPLVKIEPGAQQLSVLYSILVNQYALNQDGYSFYQKIKKNTENVGSIFDAQPSDLAGNIHCTSDPAEVVVGFVQVTEQKQKRIFISNSEVPGWGYKTGCSQSVLKNDSLEYYAPGTFPLTPTQIGAFGSIVEFSVTPERQCGDCTVTGSNVKPDFWP